MLAPSYLMPSLIKKLQAKIMHLALFLVIVLLCLYIFSNSFRVFLSEQGIDPNFLIGFFTVLALLLTLIQGSRDKRYSYNMRITDSIEDKGLRVIGKLLGIKAKSSVILSSAEHCIHTMRANKVFKDFNNATSKEDVEADMELAAAYIDTHFPVQKENWNTLIDKLTSISNITNNILINYQENLPVINDHHFKNDMLDNADEYLMQAKKIDQEIEVLTQKIRDEIVSKINEIKASLKNFIDFAL